MAVRFSQLQEMIKLETSNTVPEELTADRHKTGNYFYINET